MNENYDIDNKKIPEMLINALADLHAKQDGLIHVMSKFLSSVSNVNRQQIIDEINEVQQLAKQRHIKALYEAYGSLPPDITEILSPK